MCLVAVAAALHDDPQIVLAGEIDGDDIVRGLGGHGVHARTRGPGVNPAKRLRQPDLVIKFLNSCAQAALDGASIQAASNERTSTSRPEASIGSLSATPPPACLRPLFETTRHHHAVDLRMNSQAAADGPTIRPANQRARRPFK
jgi:hypothetical protein